MNSNDDWTILTDDKFDKNLENREQKNNESDKNDNECNKISSDSQQTLHNDQNEKEQKNPEIEETPIDDLHIIMILDESGSMGAIRNDIIGSVNTFIEEQQNLKKDNTTFTFVKFNTVVTMKIEKLPLQDVKFITQSDFTPTGGTALYDAVGNVINKYDDDKNVCVIIVTDGEENSSREFTHTKVTQFLERKKTDGWKFIYLSADLSTAKQGAGLGIYTSASGTRNVTTQNAAVGYKSLGTCLSTNCNAAIRELRTTNTMTGMGFGNFT